jgi:hypothetical protein
MIMELTKKNMREKTQKAPRLMVYFFLITKGKNVFLRYLKKRPKYP